MNIFIKTKKHLIITLIIIGVFFLLFGAPAIQGIRIKERIWESVIEADKALGPHITTKIATYDQGWFHSTIKVELWLVNSSSKDAQFAIPANIIHGPFPLLDFLAGRTKFRFFDAVVSSKFTPTSPDPVIQKALSKCTDPLVNLQAIFNNDGSFNMDVSVSELPKQTPGFKFKGAEFSLNSKEGEKLQAYFSLPDLDYSDINHIVKTSIKNLSFTFDIDQRNSSLNAHLKANLLHYSHKTFALDLSGIEGSTRQSKQKYGLPSGEGSFSIDTTKIKGYPQQKAKWQLDKIYFHETSGFEKDLYAMRARGSAQRFFAPHMEYGPITFTTNLKQLEGQAFLRLIDRIYYSNQIDKQADKELLKKAKEDILHATVDLSSNTPRLEGYLNIKQNKQNAKFAIHAALDDERAKTLPDIRELLGAVFGNVKIRATKDFFEELWKHAFAAFAASRASKKYGDLDKIEAVVGSHIQALLKAKLIIDDGKGNFVSVVDINYNKPKINTLPLDVMRIMTDFFYKPPTKIDVHFGKLAILGNVEHSTLRGIIESKKAALEQCVKTEIAEGKVHPRGVIHVKWDISEEGRTLFPKIGYSTVVDSQLESCVLSEIHSLEFPKLPEKISVISAIGFALGDIYKPPPGMKIGIIHHYKRLTPLGSLYKVR